LGGGRRPPDAAGVDLVINARTDAFIKKDQFEDPVAEAITRLLACEEAGSRCSYPVGAPDAASLQRLLDALSGPVNTIANPRKGSAAGSLDDLRAMGVHRVTFGPLLQKELAPDLAALVAPWK
jgi:2-methylisocitrate lyase-like PEP mutase family enzyme